MIKKEAVSLILILALAAFLRFWQLNEAAAFTFDEEHQFGLARTLIKNFHIIWIGVSASNLNFYLGPFFVYFTYIWLKIFGANPLPAYYIISGFGVITTLLLFYAGKKLFDSKTGIISALSYAVLPLIIYHNQKYWTVAPIPLLSLVMFVSLYLSLKSQKWWILFFTAFGLVFHIHLSLVPLGLIGTIFFIKNRSEINKRILFLAMLVFLGILSPLFAFDYFHNFTNSKAIFAPKRLASQERTDIGLHMSYLLDFLGRLWYLKPGLSSEDEIPFVCKDAYLSNLPANYDFDSIRTKPPFLVSAGSLLLLLWFLLKPSTWKNPNSRLLALSLLSVFGAFLFFPIGPSEYYLTGAFPFFLLLPGILIASNKKLTFFVWTGVIVAAVFGVNTIINTDLKYGLGVKRQLISEVMDRVKGAPFELYENGICHRYDGWRYLFMAYGRKPERSGIDSSLGWLYPEEITNLGTEYKVIMSESKVLPSEDVSKADIIEKGGFKAYILKIAK